MAPFRRHLNKKPGQSTPRTVHSKAFHATRLHEPGLPSEDAQLESESTEVDVGAEEQSSDEDDDASNVNVDPYNALLQSLNARTSASEPSRKRRKISKTGSLDKHDPVEPDGLPQIVPDDDVAEKLDVPVKDEGEDGEEADDLEGDSDDDALDPFKEHFQEREANKLKSIVKELSDKPSTTVSGFPREWKVVAGISRSSDTLIGGDNIKGGPVSIQELCIKQKLQDRAQKQLPNLHNGIDGSLARAIFRYMDLIFCGRSAGNSKALQLSSSLHAINHVLKTRSTILKNTVRLSKSNPEDQDVEYRDQGFTRPKVLFLLPTRQACANFVDMIIKLYEPEQVENRKRFFDSFSQNVDDISEDKPSDFKDLFAGNDDDLFRLGMKFTRKSIKLFAPFYTSDILFASPLGLRMAIGSEDSKKQDFDFLSSIEVVVIDHAEGLLMQNWEHVEFVFDHLNSLPKEAHGADFSRIKNWYLDGNSKYLRQTIVFSSFNTPEFNQLYARSMLNLAGRLKVAPSLFQGAILELGISVKQTFVRFDTLEPQKDPDARFLCFKNTIVPGLTKSIRSGTVETQGALIFIPSYMDFVRVRNFFASATATQNISFGSISEYTEAPEVARARSHFLSGRHSVLLYTGRAHHFRRYRVKGVKRVIMYALPDNPTFYKEVAGEFIARTVSGGFVTPEFCSVKSLFSKWDALKMERIVGSSRLKMMLKETGGDTFDFL